MDNSDNSRRTLSEALRTGSLGEEARSFLTGPAAPPPPAQVPGATPQSPPRPVTPPPDLNPPAPPAHLTTMTITPQDRSAVVIPAIVAMTFRLPASLAARLLEVSSQRKLRRERPFHQQDIVAEALTLWLRQQGLE